MKPNFALTLSFDGIGLLHRSEAGWHTVGDVPLSAPDLAAALQDLVTKAKALEASGITTKLVIPQQQIRYLHFESDSRDIDILEAQVRSTLNGATPYHVSELAYDWSMTGGEVCVAAVAIETLTEAESFAVDHGFGPVSFVAIPDEGAFQGEPFFGETVHAGEVLTPGDSVERDEDAIEVTGQAVLPQAELEPEPEPEPQPEPEAAPEPIVVLDVRPEEEPASETTTADPSAESTAEEPAEETAPMVGFQSARSAAAPAPAPATEMPDTGGSAQPDTAALSQAAPEATGDADTPDTDEADASEVLIEPPAPAMAFSSARRSAASATDTTPADLPQSRFSPAQTTQATPSAETAARGPEQEPPQSQVSKAPPAPAPDAGRLTPVPPAPPAPEELDSMAQASADSFKEPPAAIRDAIRPASTPTAPASKHPGRLPFMSKRRSEPPARAVPRTASNPSAAGSKLRGLGLRSGLSKARTAAAGLAETASNLRPKPAEPTAAERSAAQAMEDERQRMTVFGARNPDSSSPESNPRFLALALTAGLLLFLVGVAAWAALFLEGGISSLFKSSEDVQFAQEPAAIEAPARIADTDDVAIDEDTQIAALPADPVRDTEDLADESLETLSADGTISEELSPDEARARYAATGIWQVSPTPSRAPLTPDFEDVYQTSLDPNVNFSDAVALPNVARLLPTPTPVAPGNPLPPGSDDVARDARGFVLATPEGTVTPDQLVTVFAGPPPLVPPATPERAEPSVVPDDVIEAALATPEAAASEDVGLRPRARPDDVTEGFERSNNGGRTLDELQDIRPRLRPQSAQEQALAEAGIEPEIAQSDDEDQFADATDEAVASSLKPRLRPENFERIVEETRETAAAEPVSIEQRVAVAIPTTASVARAATERNQISLRRLNLIGVYGSDTSRRALVRLPNGRYQKVQVGDRLDGGQVAAIGDDELRYIKRGQSVVLKMPRS